MRVALGVCIFAICTVAFYFGLHWYLSPIPNNKPLLFSLGTVYLLNIMTELRGGRSRLTYLQVIATVLTLAPAPYLAIEFRAHYLAATEYFSSLPPDYLSEVGATDYVQAASNSVVGVGACFAASLCLIRLLAWKALLKGAEWALLTEPMKCCKFCGK